MLSRISTCMGALILFIAIALPVHLAAQSHYGVVELGELGGNGRFSQRHQRSGMDHRRRQPDGRCNVHGYSLGEWINDSSWNVGGTKQRCGLAGQE